MTDPHDELLRQALTELASVPHTNDPIAKRRTMIRAHEAIVRTRDESLKDIAEQVSNTLSADTTLPRLAWKREGVNGLVASTDPAPAKPANRFSRLAEQATLRGALVALDVALALTTVVLLIAGEASAMSISLIAFIFLTLATRHLNETNPEWMDSHLFRRPDETTEDRITIHCSPRQLSDIGLNSGLSDQVIGQFVYENGPAIVEACRRDRKPDPQVAAALRDAVQAANATRLMNPNEAAMAEWKQRNGLINKENDDA